MLEPRQVIVIFTRLPEKGEVKTRLTPPLTSEEAAALQRCMILDALALVGTKKCPIVIAYDPGRGKSFLRDMGEQVLLIEQRGGSLGERMANALEDVFAAGYSPALLMGTDIPSLPRYILKDALKVLEKKDVALGPSIDGGYYLIGMRRLHHGIFRGIRWGTSEVLSQTLSRIKKEGLSCSCLETWYDVDTPEDLLFLREHIEALRDAGIWWPRKTHEFLRRVRI